MSRPGDCVWCGVDPIHGWTRFEWMEMIPRDEGATFCDECRSEIIRRWWVERIRTPREHREKRSPKE